MRDSATMAAAKKSIREYLEASGLQPIEIRRISKLIASMCLLAIHEDRQKRQVPPAPGSVAELVDVFFNRRPPIGR